jgi:hypothetical protein
MALENYRDLSTGGTDVNAGFQFEFYCTNCNRKWKSPFKPYRMGQITGFLGRLAFLFSNAAQTGRITGTAADFGSRNAKQQALDEAMQQAGRLFSNCSVCDSGVCEDCLNASHVCAGCVAKGKGGQGGHGGHGQASAAQAAGHACPNCGTAGSGGRFCAECGFDMASTHKSCPGCGALAERSARFCGDCGHGF